MRNTGEFPVETSRPDAEAFINHVFVRSVSALKVGRCIYNFLHNYDGGMITDGVMLRLEVNRFWMVQADGELTKWYKAHAQKFDIKIKDPNVWVTQVQGPNSFDLLSDVIDGDFLELWQYFGIATVRIADEDVIISRTGFSNELGWKFYLRPKNNAEKIVNRIWEVSQAYSMMLTGTPVFRSRRIEAGLMFQAEFDETTTPCCAGLGHFVKLCGCDFIGKAALEKAYKRKRTFGMRVRGGIAKRGRPITVNGNTVGKVCLSSWSPYQECGVALVRMDHPNFGPDTEVVVPHLDDSAYTAQVCSLPMYDAEGAIVRGRKSDLLRGPAPWKG